MVSEAPSLEKYLNVRAAYQPSFAPDGQRLGFLSDITGLPQVWAVDTRGGWPDQLTFGDDRVTQLAFSPTDARLVFARDAGGNENTQLFLLYADGSGERPLTVDGGAMHVLGAWSPDGQAIAFAANRRSRRHFDLYLRRVDTAEEHLLWQNDRPGIIRPAGFSPDGRRLLVSFQHSAMNHDLYEIVISNGALRHLTPRAGEVRYSHPLYASDGQAVYSLCDLGREVAGVNRLDLADLSLVPMAHPDAEVDYLAMDPRGRYLAWAVNRDGAHQLEARDLGSGRHLAATELPMGVISPLDRWPPVISPGGVLSFSFSTPRRTTDLWCWDLQAGTLQPATRSSHAGISTGSTIEPVLIRYPTFDGREIPGWFFRPQQRSGQWPVVVYVHGGPEGQTQPLFYPLLQYLASQGYAVLAPNVRGSSGYGKAYSHLDDVEKRMDAVADLAHAVYWLRRQPEVDPVRVAIYGASYGGFMVLAALTAYPDLWAAGVDIVGISNFITFLEHTRPYRRSVREAEYGSLETDRELLIRISPIHQVDRIRAPLMVIHGANDPRVPLGEAEQIVAALDARGVPVEFLVYPDEGHGLVKLANKLDAYSKVASFLNRYLKAEHVG